MALIPDKLAFWRNDPENNGGKDSNYEDGVIDRCDHDFEESRELLPYPGLNETEVIGDFLVFPQYERVEEYCTDCGEPGLEGEPVSEPDYDYVGAKRSGERVEVANKIAVPFYRLDPEAEVPEDVPTPDYEVDEDGEVVTVEGEGEGRVLVNESQRGEEAGEIITADPVKAGGPTDD